MASPTTESMKSNLLDQEPRSGRIGCLATYNEKQTKTKLGVHGTIEEHFSFGIIKKITCCWFWWKEVSVTRKGGISMASCELCMFNVSSRYANSVAMCVILKVCYPKSRLKKWGMAKDYSLAFASCFPFLYVNFALEQNENYDRKWSKRISPTNK